MKKEVLTMNLIIFIIVIAIMMVDVCCVILAGSISKKENEETEAEVEETVMAAVNVENQVNECEVSLKSIGYVPDEMDPVYSVDGQVLYEGVQKYIYNTLKELGIEWWMPIALCQAYQESRFDFQAENANGLDKGMLQYRSTYWDYNCQRYGICADIFDAGAQIYIYCHDIQKRLAAGESMEQAISDHFTGGAYYDAQYVADVMQWYGTVQRIK